MFFHDIVHRRLVSVLQPWLREQAVIELELGLINSQATAKNLSFDVSTLNQVLLDESSRFYFKEVSVEHIIVRFSNWFVPAFKIEVHGVNVTLLAGELVEGSWRRARKSNALVEEEKKKTLARLDPQGSALHDALEKILITTASRNRFTTSMLNLVLEHCHLEMFDIKMQVQFPILNDDLVCWLELKELNAESQYFEHGCLFRGMVSAIFKPLKEASFAMDCRGFRIGYKMKDQINTFCSTDLFICTKLNDLQLVDFCIRVGELNLAFSSLHLSILSAFSTLSSKETKRIRNGTQLWRLALNRLGYSVSSPRLSFHDLVELVCLWIRYLNAYENLLSMLGCSVEDSIKKSSIKLSQDKALLSSVNFSWEVISNIEKKLPVQAIAQARRIARYRAALNIQHEDGYRHSSTYAWLGVFFKLIVFIWTVIFRILLSVLHIFFLIKRLFQETDMHEHFGIVSEESPQYCFLLNFGKILITFSPTNIGQNVNEQIESHTGISCSSINSFYLSIDALLLVYIDGIFEQSLSLSCGQLNIKPSSVIGATDMESSSMNPPSCGKGQSVDNLKALLWGDPAQMFLTSESTETSATGQADDSCNILLKKIFREMWQAWKRAAMKYEDSEIEYSENPWLLCEMKSYLTYPGLKSPGSGFLKCNLILGRLNLSLGYSSMLSVAVLLGQIQRALNWVEDNPRVNVPSSLSSTVEDREEISWESKYELYANGMKRIVHQLFPEKHIQLGVFITGPHIQMSMSKVGCTGGNTYTDDNASQDDFHLAFDVRNIEIIIWPISESDSALTVCPGFEDAETELHRLQKYQRVEIPKSDDGKYVSEDWVSLGFYFRTNGLNIYFGDSTEKQQSHILVLQPVVVWLSFFRLFSLQMSLLLVGLLREWFTVLLLPELLFSLSHLHMLYLGQRESVHSFSKTVIALSAAMYGVATGFTIMSCMDELYIFFQLVAGLFSAASYAFGSFDLIDYVPLLAFMRQNMVFTQPGNVENIAEGALLICISTLFSISSTFKFMSMDIILQNSRKNDKLQNTIKLYDALSSQKLDRHDFPDHGIWISVNQTKVEISCEELRLEALLDALGIQSIVFLYENHMGKSFDQSIVGNLRQQSHNWLYEMSLSNFTFSLQMHQPQNNLNNSMFGDNASHTAIVENSHSTTESETSRSQPQSFAQMMDFISDGTASTTSHWILLHATLGTIFVSRCSVTNVLVGAHQLNKLKSVLSVERDLNTISWGIQGGLFFLETTALMVFSQCSHSYLCCIKNLASVIKSSAKQLEPAENEAHWTTHPTQQFKWKLPETLTIDMSQFTVVLAVADGSGVLQELVIGVDVHVKLELEDVLRKFVFDLSRMSVSSQILQERVENEDQVPHFSSATSNESSSQFVPGDPAVAFEHLAENHPSYQNHILNHMVAFLAVEKVNNRSLLLSQDWVGSGSISGFDVAVSLSEIQMFLSMISSFSTASNKEITSDLKQRPWSGNQETDNSLEDIVPNGAIVAIQDIHQHMYFAVEGRENKYKLVGSIHYSLVGERALFRVKHHKQRGWRSSVLWFSLVSLYAKANSGEPLRLNYRPGSGFVEISSTDDGARSLWRALPCEPESYKGDIDRELYCELVKETFYLVNKKNDSAVAFVDGIPELVGKPGNPFKFKVFQDIALAHDVTSYGYPFNVFRANPSMHETETQSSQQSGSRPCIKIKIDCISLTIVHELPDTKDRFPLLRGCISNTQFNIQILPYKIRVISTSNALLHYLDAQRNLWRELVRPFEICAFYRWRFEIQDSEAVRNGVPVHIYCRTKELDISLSELSLDILLFVIGKLNLAGPFSVRSSMILANCCKVENESGLTLLCHFYNKSVTVARKQSASVYLRCQPATENQPSENASVASIQLSNLGSFATSSLQLSLLKTQAFAWRTRIMSLQDSRTYPGPFVVIDISRKSEDFLSLVVSPMVRIHNETEFSMELRFQRPEENEDVFASVLLKKGESIDDSIAAFDAISFSGGLKKALMSLSVGNFLFSFRPEITNDLINSESSPSVEWSDELKGEKAVRLSGIFDKLGYKVRRAFSVESEKCSFTTTFCALKSEAAVIANLHFLIQTTGRDVPIIQPDKSNDGLENRNSSVALQEQKEIFLLPTVRVSNLLHSEISVLLTETGTNTAVGSENIGKQATIAVGSTVDFYVNPTIIYFTVTLTAFSSSCKPVNSGDWTKKLLKNKNDVQFLDIDLEFNGGKYFASLRLFRGLRGVLEAAIFTPYSLKNDTDFALFLWAPNQKPLSKKEIRKFESSIPPELGLYLPPNAIKSWFLRSHKMRLKLLEEHASEALLDLDALSGPTEISLVKEGGYGVKYVTQLGVSTGPYSSKVVVPSQTITVVPRHVVYNESEESITVRQCFLEDEMAGLIHINSKQRTALQLQNGNSRSREFSLFENIIKKHRNDVDTALVYVQFQPDEHDFGWSGPVCIASLGHFFLKFRKQSSQMQVLDNNAMEFASVHIVEEGSTLGMHFHKPPLMNLPYRIENHLRYTSISYYQKDSSERDVLGSECSAYYVWDDLTLPHKLVLLITDMHLLREINLDKVRSWKPLLKLGKSTGLTSHSILDKKSSNQKTYFGRMNSMEIVKVGYEVYAEGPTRVLRICEFSDRHKGDMVFQSCAKIRLRVSHFATHLLEHNKQDLDGNEEFSYTPIIVARFGNFNLDSVFADHQKYNQIRIQSLNVDHKWTGAPFASMLRRHQLDFTDSNTSMLKIIFVFLSTSSDVRQIKYSSIVLQPIDVNLDEETLMRLALFWRTSLSDSSSPSQRYYFDHFEVHPIKIIANFLPGETYSSYNSAQETLRSLLHSVVKVPTIKNMVVELNGVLVTHALITIHELFIRCAQHYSWYAMRAIYIAKGSPFLPPAFVSIFDDLASSSLDVFFDPSHGLVNLPGFTVGTFKFISKCIDGKGFSGTKRYFGDLGKTLRTVGSNVLFAAITEISDSVLKGAEASGFDGMMSGFHQGILKLAMEPSLLGTALLGGGPDRKIKLDRSPGVDELYIEGYLQAMLDTVYRQEYLRVRVIDDEVVLKNLPPNSALIDEIMDRVKGFLVSKALLKGDSSAASRPLRHLRGESEWKIGPTVMTLFEHLFVSFAIRILRKKTIKFIANINLKKPASKDDPKISAGPSEEEQKVRFAWKWGIGKFVFSGILAYIDGRLCRCIPNPVARRIVSGYLLSFLDKNDDK